MSEPPLKKLRQSSILDSFSFRGALQKNSSDPSYLEASTSQFEMASGQAPLKKSASDTEALDDADSQEQAPELSYDQSIKTTEELDDDGLYFKSGRVGKVPWKGIPLSSLRRTPLVKPRLERLRNSKADDERISVLFDVNKSSNTRYGYFGDFDDRWKDPGYVKMPFSAHNVITSAQLSQNAKAWEVIKKYLGKEISSFYDFRQTIFRFNPSFKDRWNFSTIKEFFTGVFEEEETEYMFNKVLPGMANLALEAERVCTKPIRFLSQRRRHTLVFTQRQVASLLANAFFCTFPARNAMRDCRRCPTINFNTLFEGGRGSRKIEKLKCLFNYFRRVVTHMPEGVISFRRQSARLLPDWSCSRNQLTAMHVTTDGVIETEGSGMLQVDFANKYLGGGVLSSGLVQEEIRFVICPELLISRLFTEALLDNEALVMTGCEQYSKYTGYSNTFEFAGNHVDETDRDAWGRRMTEVVAIDALVFHSKKDQFSKANIDRELNKAYVGFWGGSEDVPLPAVATGNWGCGAFGGDKQLKALLQLLAAAECKRQLCYFTFGDALLRDELHTLHSRVVERGLTVGELYSQIVQYGRGLRSGACKMDLYEYINANLGFPPDTGDYCDSTDVDSDADCALAAEAADSRGGEGASPGKETGQSPSKNADESCNSAAGTEIVDSAKAKDGECS